MLALMAVFSAVGAHAKLRANIRHEIFKNGAPSTDGTQGRVSMPDQERECRGCDFKSDGLCKRCLEEETMMVVCTGCLYLNGCLAVEAGNSLNECERVGDRP